jgi:hypothetical protein
MGNGMDDHTSTALARVYEKNILIRMRHLTNLIMATTVAALLATGLVSQAIVQYVGGKEQNVTGAAVAGDFTVSGWWYHGEHIYLAVSGEKFRTCTPFRFRGLSYTRQTGWVDREIRFSTPNVDDSVIVSRPVGKQSFGTWIWKIGSYTNLPDDLVLILDADHTCDETLTSTRIRFDFSLFRSSGKPY